MNHPEFYNYRGIHTFPAYLSLSLTKTRQMKILIWLIVIILILGVIYALGPKPATPELKSALPQLSLSVENIEAHIAKQEASVKIKPDNEARIVWADSTHSETLYSVVYLHGFSASGEEGAPLHRNFAKRYGCNLYIPRLNAHGLKDEDAFLDFTADKWLESVKEAIAIGKILGDKVILMATSTGGTAALYLSAYHPDIFANLLYSPNIAIKDANSWMLNNPWGLQLTRMMMGGKYRSYEDSDAIQKYWYTKYRVEGLCELQSLVEHTMKPAIFEKVNQPVFLGYYYKSETEQDATVSVEAMLNMFDQLSTPEAQKRKVAFPEAEAHVIASPLTSNAADRVQEETFKFAEEVLGLRAMSNEQ